MARSPGKGGLTARATTSRQSPQRSPGKGGLGAPGGGVAGDTVRNTQPLGATPGLTKTITGAVSGTGSRIRLTATAHGLDTGQQVTVSGVVGTTEANGQWTAVVVTANTVELAGSTFTNAYSSGGTLTRF
jgi:hypothetical protein